MCPGGPVIVSFDSYSDFVRGTFGAGADIYDRPEAVKAFIDRCTELSIAGIRANPIPERMVFIPMHKAMDGFMSDDHYAEFYWPYLLAIVEAIIDVGMTPYVYTEGPYYSRLKFLAQLPVGKCVVHFEGVDMAVAKRELGDIACLSGNFPAHFLLNASKQQVVDKVKALLDVCAPGGGYIFDLDGGLYDYPAENVAAMYETVKEYGKY
jgi:uroporphyrinogen-III decarboxylase